MADSILHTVPADRDLSTAYCRGALAFEDLALDLERVRDSAHTLACSQSFEERAQNVFYAIGELCDRLHNKTKDLEDEFSGLAAKHRES